MSDVLLPVCIGRVFNISPVLINEKTHTYAVADDAVNDITVRIDGQTITADVDLSGGQFSLSQEHEGAVTADVEQRSDTMPTAIRYLANRLGLAEPQLLHCEAHQLNANIGIWINQSESYWDIMNLIAQSVRCIVRTTALNTLEIVHIDHTRAADQRITLDDIIETSAPETLHAVSELTLKYRKNYTPQPDIVGYENEWQTDTLYNPNHDYPFGWIEPLDIETCLVNQADALNELTRRAAWRFGRRREYPIQARLRGVQTRVGDRVHITHPHWGLDHPATVTRVDRIASQQTVGLEVIL